MNKNANVHRNSASFVRHCGNPLSLITGFMPVTTEMALFDYPFNELLVGFFLLLIFNYLFSIISFFFFVIDVGSINKTSSNGLADVDSW